MTLKIDINTLLAENLRTSNQFYLPYEIMFAKAECNKLIDINGKKYIDFTSNADNISLGYDHFLLKSIFNAKKEYPLYSAHYFYTDLAYSLIDKIATLTSLDAVYLSNSSSEAMDTAIRLLQLWTNKTLSAKHKNEIIILNASSVSQKFNVYTLSAFHDDNNLITTPAGLNYKSSFMADTSTLKNIISKNTAAILLNPFDIMMGSYIIDHEILLLAKKLCDKNDLALIFDLTSISLGRTGSLLPSFPVDPDILLLSKGVGQGIPIGITVTSEKLSCHSYQHPYGVNLLACHIAGELIDFLKESKIQQDINKSAMYLRKILQKIQDKYLNILEIKSKGLLASIEMDFDLREFVERCLEDGIIVELADSRLIKLTPPFTITEEELNKLYEVFDKHLAKLKSDYRLK